MMRVFFCRGCASELTVDLERGPTDVFIAACPKCSQRYRISKRSSAEQRHPVQVYSTGQKDFSCHGCQAQLSVDLRKGPADLFIAACPTCRQRYRLSRSPVVAAHQAAPTTASAWRKDFACNNCHTGLTVDLGKAPSETFIAACPQCDQRFKLTKHIRTTTPIKAAPIVPHLAQAATQRQTAPLVGGVNKNQRRSGKRAALIAGSIVVLGGAIYSGTELSKRHTLTEAERAQAENWFAAQSGKNWVLVTAADNEVPEQGLDIKKPTVQADKYGEVTISVAFDLSAYTSDFALGRFSGKLTRRYDALAEPQELDLTGNPPDEQRLTLRVINPDSMTLSIRNADGSAWGEYSAIPMERFNALAASRSKGQQQALIAEVDALIAQGGLVRRGVFHAYACGDECGATFMEPRNGNVVPVTYVCNNNRFGDIQLSQGDMLGAGDFTNKALVGQRFLIVSKLVTLPDHEGIPIWVVQGLFPDVEGGGFPELDQRLALSANFDAGAGMTPTGAGTSEATLNTPVSFLDDSDILDSKDVQQQPEFPGGMEKMYEFMATNQHYPDMEYEAGIQGKVYVQFTVSKDGSIKDTRVLRSVSEGLDREALRLVKSMPRWMPGSLDGRPVNCRFNLPITFRLK